MLLITGLSQKVYFVVAVTITIMQISRYSTNQITLLVCQAPLIVDTSSSNVRVVIESTTGHHEACNQNVFPSLIRADSRGDTILLYCRQETLQDSLGSVVGRCSQVKDEPWKPINTTMHNHSPSTNMKKKVLLNHFLAEVALKHTQCENNMWQSTTFRLRP